ncbi:hypothetical protein NEOKW01_0196 [Nematocida sp. AWRm80]|nr:hypothetical protein NEOKW01_0196 [Nematocida sp. AWRm80]
MPEILCRRKEATNAYAWDANKFFFIKSVDIAQIPDLPNPKNYSLCLVFPNSISITDTYVSTFKNIQEEYNILVLWRNYPDKDKEEVEEIKALKDKAQGFISKDSIEYTSSDAIPNLNLIAYESTRFMKGLEKYKDEKQFISYGVGFKTLQYHTSAIKNKSVFYLYFDTCNKEHTTLLRIFQYNTNIKSLNIVVGYSKSKSPKYFSLCKAPGAKSINANNKKLLKQKEIPSLRKVQDEESKTLLPSILLEKIEHLSLISAIAYSVIFVRASDLIGFVTKQLDISFTVWLLLELDLNPISRPYLFNDNQKSQSFSFEILTIYPIIEDKPTQQNQEVYTYDNYVSNYMVKHHLWMQRYAITLKEYLENTSNTRCANYIKKILYCTTMTYTNLTKLVFYAYISEKTAVEEIVATYHTVYSKNSNVYIPHLKQIKIVYINDSSDHKEFYYDYYRARIETKKYNFE